VNTTTTDPLNPDTDTDGLTDGDEVNTHETDPLDADSDDDGLNDGDEVNTHGTDPLDADSDDGGVIDGEEVSAGTNPLDPTDDVPGPDDSGLDDTGDSIDDVGLPKGGGGLSCATTTSQPWWAGVVAALGALWARRKRAA
jgi:MYXO-CTERM domain-containing protein